MPAIRLLARPFVCGEKEVQLVSDGLLIRPFAVLCGSPFVWDCLALLSQSTCLAYMGSSSEERLFCERSSKHIGSAAKGSKLCFGQHSHESRHWRIVP